MLPITTNLRAHYDFSQTSSVFFGVAGVSSVLDQSPFGNDLFQTVLSAQPLTGFINGLNAIDTSANSGVFLETALPIIIGSEDRTIFIVADPFSTPFPDSNTVFSLTNSPCSNGRSYNIDYGSNAIIDSTGFREGFFTSTGTGKSISTIRHDAFTNPNIENAEWYFNGNKLDQISVINGPIDTLAISAMVGNAPDHISNFDGLIGEIIVYNDFMPLSDIQTTEAFLQAKWGTPSSSSSSQSSSNSSQSSRSSNFIPIADRLVAWWDFSDTDTISYDGGGKVSAVQDLTIFGNNLSQVIESDRPLTGTINGLQAVDFTSDLTINMLSDFATVTGDDDRTIFMVIDPFEMNFTEGRGGLISLTDSSVGSEGARFVLHHEIGVAVRVSGAKRYTENFGIDPTIVAVQYNSTLSPTTQGIRVWKDGNEFNNILFDTDSNINTNNTRNLIGNRHDGLGGFYGLIGEIGIFNTALGFSDRNEVFDYLRSKWFTAESSSSISRSSFSSSNSSNSSESLATLVNYPNYRGDVIRVGTVNQRCYHFTRELFQAKNIVNDHAFLSGFATCEDCFALISSSSSSSSHSSSSISSISSSQSSQSSSQSSSSSAVAGIFAFYNFDEGSGNVAFDGSGNDFDATIDGPVYVDGRCNTALSYVNPTDKTFITSGASLGGTTDFSLNVWAKTDVSADFGTQTLIAQRDQVSQQGMYRLFIQNVGRAFFQVYDGTNQFAFNTTNKLDDTDWHMYTAVREGLSGRVYIDGVLDKTVEGSFIASLDSNIDVGIGHDLRATTATLSGAIDQVSIWDRALSDFDVADFYFKPCGSSSSKSSSSSSSHSSSSDSSGSSSSLASDVFLFDQFGMFLQDQSGNDLVE